MAPRTALLRRCLPSPPAPRDHARLAAASLTGPAPTAPPARRPQPGSAPPPRLPPTFAARGSLWAAPSPAGAGAGGPAGGRHDARAGCAGRRTPPGPGPSAASRPEGMAGDSSMAADFLTGGFAPEDIEDGSLYPIEDVIAGPWQPLSTEQASVDCFTGEGSFSSEAALQRSTSEVEGTLQSSASNQTNQVFDFGEPSWMADDTFVVPIPPPMTPPLSSSVQEFGMAFHGRCPDRCPVPSVEHGHNNLAHCTPAHPLGEALLPLHGPALASPRSSVNSPSPGSAGPAMPVTPPLLEDIPANLPCEPLIFEAECPMWGAQAATDFLMDSSVVPLELVAQLDDPFAREGAPPAPLDQLVAHISSGAAPPAKPAAAARRARPGARGRAVVRPSCGGAPKRHAPAAGQSCPMKKLKPGSRAARHAEAAPMPSISLSARGRAPKPRRLYAEDDASDGDASEPNRRRKHHNPWDVDETAALVEGVERCGEGKWAEIKKLAFPSIAARSAVDLKDKWRNLMRVALAPKSQLRAKSDKKREIPGELLARVCALAAAAGKKLRPEPKGGAGGRVSCYSRRYTT